MRRWAAILIVMLAAVLVSCSAGPSPRPPIIAANAPSAPAVSSAPTTPVLPPLRAPSPGELQWRDCDGATLHAIAAQHLAAVSVRCTQLVTLLGSPNSPGQGVARTALLKVGSGPIPLLVLNDTAGEPGRLYAARLAATLPASVLHRYSLIGVDRRGTGASQGVNCVPVADRATILGYPPNSVNTQALLQAQGDAAQQCVQQLQPALPAIDTAHAVTDLEVLRQQLGAARLDAIGHGDGSRVLADYATKYPHHTGRFVLDGAPDPTQTLQASTEQQAVAAEHTFDSYAGSCGAGCALSPDPRKALRGILAAARARPLPSDSGIRITEGMLVRAVSIGIATERSWHALTVALSRAQHGDGSGIAAILAPYLHGSSGAASRLDARLVIGCNDTAARPTPKAANAAVGDWRNAAPLFGGSYAHRLLLCNAWPLPASPLPTPTADGAPPILVISSADDPVTPQQASQDMARSLRHGVLVNWAGTGHDALPRSACVTDAAVDFLVKAKVPTTGTVCPP